MSDDQGARGPSKQRRPTGISRAELEDRVRARREQFEEANERITARSGRNLLSAVAIGVVLAALMVVSLVFITELFLVFVGLIACVATVELVAALNTSGRFVPVVPSVVSAAAVSVLAFYGGASGQWLTLLAGVGFVVLWRLVMLVVPAHRTGGWRQLARDLAAAVLVQAYGVFLGSIAILLVAQPDGRWWTLAFIVVVICVDTGAYAAGLNFGKHPMAPRISPKKTWEGFAGALLIAVVAAVLLAVLLLQQPWWVGLVFGVVLTLTATFGDLAESLMKRDMGIKDMSTWLPGHGGFLDRLDSMLPSAAAAYALYVVFS